MNIYVVYEKKTGRIIHTTSRYVLGNDNPIAWPEEEILSLTRREVGSGVELGVTQVPDDFDVRDRTRILEIDVEKGVCHTREVERPTPRKMQKQRQNVDGG